MAEVVSNSGVLSNGGRRPAPSAKPDAVTDKHVGTKKEEQQHALKYAGHRLGLFELLADHYYIVLMQGLLK